MQKHVAVLMGGFSSEREVSLRSGKACSEVLNALGYRVTPVDVQENIAQVLQEIKPDIAFNALHGPYGEDGCIQGILEFLKIPYTHSGVTASALAMHKSLAKQIAKDAGVPVASSKTFNRFSVTKDHPIDPPYVLKPLYEGSSFGVLLVCEGEPFPYEFLTSKEWLYGDMVMVERYIPGRELTCAVMGDKALAVCEIVFCEDFAFYDHQAKYKKTATKHICPAKISSNIYQNVQKFSLLAHQALGCRGITRSDFRYDEKNAELIWLEINTQPGMTETSLVPDVAKYEGIDFANLVKWLVEDASCMR